MKYCKNGILALILCKKVEQGRVLVVYAIGQINIFKNIVLNLMNRAQLSSHSLDEPQNAEVAGFIAKTFQILNNDEFNKIAFWSSSGQEFIIKDTLKFQQTVLPRYFRHNKINSFVRQLNMYGFHKSRTDHSKSVFSHPFFLKDREDLLITIKRKIKGILEKQSTEVPATPLKPKANIESQATTAKKEAETGNQLTSVLNLHCPDMNNTSFNILCTKQKLHSIMNLNFTLNRIPQIDMDASIDGGSDDDEMSCVSIGLKIEAQDIPDKREGNASYKFMNPSCFFESMKKHNDI